MICCNIIVQAIHNALNTAILRSVISAFEHCSLLPLVGSRTFTLEMKGNAK